MNSLKKSFIVYSFLAVLGGIILWAETIEWKRSSALKNESTKKQNSYDQESYFQEASFYRVEKGSATLHLDADEMTINSSTQKSLFVNPRGVAFTNDARPVQYKAQEGFLIQGEQKVIFEGEVEFDLNKSKLQANEVTYYMNKDEIFSRGDVFTESVSQVKGKPPERIKVWSDSSYSYPERNISRYIGNVRGTIRRNKVYEESIHFKSEKVEVDLNTLKIDLTDSVEIKKQQLTAQSLRGEIFLENYNKKLKYFVLYDDVKVVEKVELEKDGRVSSFMRRAFGEKLEGIMSDNKIIITGYPKVFQQSDVITGNKIVLRENNEVVEVDDANTNFIIR
ncbi:LPS export ABC transporter periplasmic protein LptC [Halobacteriovorax sp. HLS]|uniref:LPS export ABC transporter periplasmic protein LptC n=1 Tax=Halobacteriovorax sp. HLS TaxID=2234000 RepID=UPI0013E34AD0|nr:LPS export ABC transporter periplasmic protein LptC [Halobacteriovorax sp. HLS]